MSKSIYDLEEGDRLEIDDGFGGREVVIISDVYDSSVRYFDSDNDGWKVTYGQLENLNAVILEAK